VTRPTMQLDRLVARDGHSAFSRCGMEQENPQRIEISLAPIPVLAGSFPIKCQNKRHSLRGKKPRRQHKFDPLKENKLSSFHKRFLFKIAPSVLKPAGEDTAPGVILDQFRISSWMPLGTAGLPWARLLFFHEIQSTSCSEGPNHAAMTATALLFSSHSNIHHQNSGRKDWHESVFKMKTDKRKHHD